MKARLFNSFIQNNILSHYCVATLGEVLIPACFLQLASQDYDMTLKVKKKEAGVPQGEWISGCPQLSAYAHNPLLSKWLTCRLGEQCPELRQS